MAYTTINKSTDYFNTKLYSGNASYGHAITGVGFQPDWVWIKRRDGSARNHELYDAVRGTDKSIYSSSTSAESTSVNLLHSFDSDGFTVDDHAGINGNDSFASWNWKAGNSSGSSNSDGSQSSTVSVNTAAGFSIVKYTGYGAATYGHGLGTTPQMIIIKKLNSSDDWFVYHHTLLTPSATQKQFILLNSTDAFASNGSATTFTSVSNSTFGVGTDDKISESGDSFIAYAFASKTGYSKFGSYTGTNGLNFIYTGFKPKWCMFKRTDGTDNWKILDSARSTFNIMNETLSADTSSAEASESDVYVDFLSNGIRLDGTNGAINANGGSYIFMAFGQSLVGSNNVPCTAR